MDPTVARGGAPGPASDVFGVAAAAFHALTGIAPWNAATPGDVLDVAAAGLLPDLAELAPEAPEGLLEVVARGLSADPHHRGSAAAFALDLRHACRPEPVGLPVAGMPDADLVRRGPRTELTHQVPGRRPRPIPVVVHPAGRTQAHREAARRWLRTGAGSAAGRAALIVLVGAGLTGLVWSGLRFADAAERGDDERRAPAAAPAAASPGTPPDGTGAVGPTGLDPVGTPASAADWRPLLEELYARRARSFATAAPDLLGDVYSPGSPQLAADAEHARALAAAGQQLRGFSPAVVAVTGASVRGDRAVLDLVDRWPDYEVVPSGGGPAVQRPPGRPETAVRMVLLRTPEGWRIESAERVG